MLIVIALGAVALGIVQKFSGPSRPSQTAPAGGYVLPKDASVVEMQTSGNRLILRVRSKAGEEIDIVDTSDGRLIARIK